LIFFPYLIALKKYATIYIFVIRLGSGKLQVFLTILIIVLFFILLQRMKASIKKMIVLFGIFIVAVNLTVGCTAEDDVIPKQEQQSSEKSTPVQKPPKEKNMEADVDVVNEKSPVKGINGKVISVTDGDTLKVQLENGLSEKVRLILVDTPETKHPRLGVQPFGKEASAFTTKELTGKQVTLELDVEERDQYGRLLAYVWVGNTLFNEKLLEEGLARVAVYPPNTKYVDQFRKVQANAQAAGKGIWSIENYAQEDGYHSNRTEESSQASNPSSDGSYVNDPSDDQETNLACKGKIKGNANSKIYHIPGGSYYDSTKDNIVWFCSEADAEAAGYRKSKR
jgi:micrococcal nuclease